MTGATKHASYMRMQAAKGVLHAHAGGQGCALMGQTALTKWDKAASVTRLVIMPRRDSENNNDAGMTQIVRPYKPVRAGDDGSAASRTNKTVHLVSVSFHGAEP